MKKFLFLLIFGFIISACNSDDDNPEPQPEVLRPDSGVYQTSCVQNNSVSSRVFFDLKEDNDLELYSMTYGTTDCSGAGTLDGSDDGSAEFTEIDLGEGVSYFKFTVSGNSAYFAYKIDNGTLYLSDEAPTEPVDSDGPETVFADFIANPVAEAKFIFIKAN